MNYLESMQKMCNEYRKKGGNFTKFAISKEKEISSWRYATEDELAKAVEMLTEIEGHCHRYSSKLRTLNFIVNLSISILVLCFVMLHLTAILSNSILLVIILLMSIIVIPVCIVTAIIRMRLYKKFSVLERDRKVCNSCIQSKQDYNRIDVKS